MSRALSALRTLPGRLSLALLAVVVTFGVALFSTEFLAQQWALWVIFGQLALSLTFVWGYGGIFSFGQGALFGVGAYAYGITAINLSPHTGETYTALLVAALVAAAFAGVLGYFIFYGNVGELYVGIITLAVTLVLLTFMSSTGSPSYHIGGAQFGGYNGMTGVPGLGSATSALNAGYLLIVVVAITAVVVLALDTLLRRPYGRVLVAVRENELRSQLLGYDVRRVRLSAFVIGGAVAGLAGGEFAAWGQFVNPAVFSLQQAALIVIWTLVGGRRSLLGAFVGAFVIQELQSVFAGSDVTPIVLGSILILVVLVAPEGIMAGVWSLLTRAGVPIGRRPVPARRRPVDVAEPRSEQGADVDVVDATKTFGGVHALESVSVRFDRRTTTALLGPNGAGKSTFFNLVVGRYPVTSGRITLDGRDITRLPAYRRAQLGLGIKTQVPSVYNELAVRENVWLAAYGKKRDAGAADVVTQRVLDDFAVGHQQLALMGDLAHGQRQWVEIAMVVAGHPQVVLLDEPTAGMTRAETTRTAALVRRLAEGATVIVVEHDMEFVRQLDTRVVMFHEGRVFRTGSIEELRSDEQVLDIYLGRAVVHAATS